MGIYDVGRPRADRTWTMRRLWLAATLAAGMVLTGAPPATALDRDGDFTPLGGIDLQRATVLDLQHAMRRQRLTSVGLTRFYLHRIRALNPVLHAVIETNPDAAREAAASDAR